MKKVCGVGVNDRTAPARINTVITKEYMLWMAMIRVCYSKYFNRSIDTYKDLSVSENFKNYSYFYNWCKNQVGFNIEGFELNRTLLLKGNKFYSEELCVFIPLEIVAFIKSQKRSSKILPIGVTMCSDKDDFRARVSIDGKNIQLGRFNSCESAFIVCKGAYEDKARELAKKWKGIIDDRAYNALLNYTVTIND